MFAAAARWSFSSIRIAGRVGRDWNPEALWTTRVKEGTT